MQVYAKLNSTGFPAIRSASAIYEGVGITFSFSGLTPDMHYKLVMYATSEDPSIFRVNTKDPVFIEATLPACISILKMNIGAFMILLFVVLLWTNY